MNNPAAFGISTTEAAQPGKLFKKTKKTCKVHGKQYGSPIPSIKQRLNIYILPRNLADILKALRKKFTTK
jgi:hypothetical protein